MPTHRLIAASGRWPLGLVVLAVLVHGSAAALVEVPGAEARFGWTPPPQGAEFYEVQVSRNGGDFALFAILPGSDPTVSIPGEPGETLVVRVRAALAGALSPFSEPSEEVRFAAAPPPQDPTGGGSTGDAGSGDPGSDTGSTGGSDPGSTGGEVGSGSEDGSGGPDGTPAAAVRVASFGIDAARDVLVAYALDGTPLAESPLAVPAGTDTASLAALSSASCDVDGDGTPEYAIGFGSGGQGLIAIRQGPEEGYGALDWIQVDWDWYNRNIGATRPSCGDVDGDGREEIVVGLAGGSRGWMLAYEDAALGFRPLALSSGSHWFQFDWPWYNARNGETRPTLGDVDGDGRDEVVVGLGRGGNGYFVVLDDAASEFADRDEQSWFRVDLAGYNAANGETRPAVGDLDGDGVDEIVLGLGSGGWSQLLVFDDMRGGLAPMGPGWIQSGWEGYHQADGSTRPAVGDVDGDGTSEILVELGAAGRGWIQVLDGRQLVPVARGGASEAGWVQGSAARQLAR